ncbi:MAG: DivIVA domain-containing protein [Chlorobia bacterium]|nr:DivIVA domain-containing protein [Fimbriimonadaceae bacterium]
MDRMMPIDLERAELKTSMRGYDRTQVQALLQRAAKEMATLRSEIESNQTDLHKLRQEVEGFRAQENTLKEALILAQRTADETRAHAHKEADLITGQAKQKSAEVESEMQTKINDLRWELERLRLDKQKFLNTFRGMLEAQLRDLTESGGFAVVEGSAVVHAVEA